MPNTEIISMAIRQLSGLHVSVGAQIANVMTSKKLKWLTVHLLKDVVHLQEVELSGLKDFKEVA